MAEDEIERKFLVLGFKPTCEWPVPHEVSIIEQTYLSDSERVRRRFYPDDSRSVFTHTIKTRVGPGHNLEDEHEVDAAKYIELAGRADPSRKTIHKVRKVFDWCGHTFELDVFNLPPGVIMLEVELPSLDAPVELPPFITIDREVTDDKAWSNAALSKLAYSLD